MSRNDLVVQVEKIDQRMRELERERIDVLCQDLEYAAYLNRCDLCGRLERLPIQRFWTLLDQMKEIEAGAPPDDLLEARRYWLEKSRAYHELETNLALDWR